ncbi:peroxidase [Vibrio sp. V09_P4A23P171]|uniref:peroxidase n=2 Tax=unclassified Vibrio TaxID=2614977 RepID=UPI001C3C2476|nr:peroxidase [Vibrio sp. V09_P4A23P171]
MKQPWELNSSLTSQRIQLLASLMREVRDSVIDLHDDFLGDSARSTGLRAYECCRNQIIRASANKEVWPWLGIVKSDGRFTFSIDSVPVRLYRGKPSSPEERRLIPSIEALCQMSLLSVEVGDAAAILWFFAIEVDELRYVERVTFTGFLDGTQVSCWEVPLDEKVPAFNTIGVELPEPVATPKAPVYIKKKEEKAQNDGQSDGQ